MISFMCREEDIVECLLRARLVITTVLYVN